MRVLLFLFFILFSNQSKAYETWLHRAQEYTASTFEYVKDCSLGGEDSFIKTFDFTKIEAFQGIELDIFYRSDLDQIVIYHGDDNSEGSTHFQCFKGRYYLLDSFYKIFRERFPNKKIWLDLKNDNLLGVMKSMNKLRAYSQNTIVETKSYLGAVLAESYNLETSLWIKLKKKKKFKSYLNIKIAQLLGLKRLSQDCRTLYDFHNEFSGDVATMCWNTRYKLESSKLKEISSLKVLLLGL